MLSDLQDSQASFPRVNLVCGMQFLRRSLTRRFLQFGLGICVQKTWLVVGKYLITRPDYTPSAGRGESP